MPMLYQNHPAHFVIKKFDRLYGRHVSLLLPVFHFSLLTRTFFLIKHIIAWQYFLLSATVGFWSLTRCYSNSYTMGLCDTVVSRLQW